MSRAPAFAPPAPLDARDAPEIRALFAQVFGVPMSEALWRWKYAEGRGFASGLRAHDGALVAHYGGTCRSLCAGAQSIAALQMGDVMVRPDARAILSRNGPFAQVTRHFIGHHLGDAAGHALGFGFPGPRHARLGERLGLYRALDEVRQRHWQAAPVASPGLRRWRLTPLASDTAGLHAREIARLDACWAAMQAALPGWVVPMRDGAWCQHRYGMHPDHPYQLHWVQCRLSGHRVGAVVLRPPARSDAGASWEWLDWIGPPSRMMLALALVRTEAARAGAGAVHGWFSAPLLGTFLAPRAGRTAPGEPSSPDLVICTGCVTMARARSVPADIDRRAWWLTSGDTDFR